MSPVPLPCSGTAEIGDGPVKSIPEMVLDSEVGGVNLSPGTLRAQLGDEPTLLVFLRHFG